MDATERITRYAVIIRAHRLIGHMPATTFRGWDEVEL